MEPERFPWRFRGAAEGTTSNLHRTENIGQKHCYVHVNWMKEWSRILGGCWRGHIVFPRTGRAHKAALCRLPHPHLGRPPLRDLPVLCCDASSRHLANMSLPRSWLRLVSGCHSLCLSRVLEDRLP